MPCPGDPANSVYVSLGLDANAGSRPGPAGCADTYQANYEDLEAWAAARGRNLITADETEIIECYDDWPSGLNHGGRVDIIDAFTADETHRPIIRAAQGNAPTNVPEDGFHIIGTGSVLRFQQPYGILYNIGIVGNLTGSIQYVVRMYDDLSVQAIRCFIRCNGSVGRAVYAATAGGDCNIRNCFIWGGGYGIDFGNTGHVAWNNTIKNASIAGINSGSSSARIRNNVVFDTTGSDFVVSTSNVGGNVSQDGTAPGSVYTITDPTTEFVNSDGSDLHLLEGCGFRGLGDDLSAAIEYPFNDDIDGDTRSAWDPGADEFQGAAPPSAVQNAILQGMEF